jgi:hypothetical protein
MSNYPPPTLSLSLSLSLSLLHFLFSSPAPLLLRPVSSLRHPVSRPLLFLPVPPLLFFFSTWPAPLPSVRARRRGRPPRSSHAVAHYRTTSPAS